MCSLFPSFFQSTFPMWRWVKIDKAISLHNNDQETMLNASGPAKLTANLLSINLLQTTIQPLHNWDEVPGDSWAIEGLVMVPRRWRRNRREIGFPWVVGDGLELVVRFSKCCARIEVCGAVCGSMILCAAIWFFRGRGLCEGYSCGGLGWVLQGVYVKVGGCRSFIVSYR